MKVPDLVSLTGTFSVPADRRNASWDEIIRTTRSLRAARFEKHLGIGSTVSRIDH